jgi:hypothetical protein
MLGHTTLLCELIPLYCAEEYFKDADTIAFLSRLGWENSLGLSPYNNRFRAYRKNMSRIIGSKVLASQFNALQEAEVGHFLLHVLEKPEDLLQHIRKSVLFFLLRRV